MTYPRSVSTVWQTSKTNTIWEPFSRFYLNFLIIHYEKEKQWFISSEAIIVFILRCFSLLNSFQSGKKARLQRSQANEWISKTMKNRQCSTIELKKNKTNKKKVRSIISHNYLDRKYFPLDTRFFHSDFIKKMLVEWQFHQFLRHKISSPGEQRNAESNDGSNENPLFAKFYLRGKRRCFYFLLMTFLGIFFLSIFFSIVFDFSFEKRVQTNVFMLDEPIILSCFAIEDMKSSMIWQWLLHYSSLNIFVFASFLIPLLSLVINVYSVLGIHSLNWSIASMFLANYK